MSSLATASEPVQALYSRNIAPALAAPRRRFIYYLDITGGIQSRMKEIDYLFGFLETQERDKLRKLRELYKTKLEIDAHYTVQQALRGWLYAHVPLSLALLGFVILHVFAVMYY